MEVRPILSTLRRNKVGALLVTLQIALTLAVVANALAVIQKHWTDMNRPSGVDEANIFTVANQWVGGSADDLAPRIQADVAALRALPGVVDAEATNSFPLSGNFYITGIRLKREQSDEKMQTSLFFNTAHGLATQGLKIVAGRWFRSDEISDAKQNRIETPIPSVVITAGLARQLFPDGSALGRSVFINDNQAPIIGIVERASAASGGTFGDIDNSTFLPFASVNNFLFYIVRTRPGAQAAVMAAAKPRLLELSRMRIINGIQTFAQSRKRLYAVAAATSGLLATVCALLLIITACGTVGLTMCWVAQRRRQIGMRRALGARRSDILRYFHTENLLIAGAGALLGIVGGLSANLYLATHLAVTRMSPAYICIGALIVLCLSQLAVLWPAMRASSISPAGASRGL